jgi:prepilin-type N-terminal cleavage/methylation domain-containing protein
MMTMRNHFSDPAASKNKAEAGFTLVELIVSTAVAGILGLAIVANYIMQTRSYEIQREMAHMQQNLRAAMYMLNNDIRNSGRDSERTGRYGLVNIRRSNPDGDDPNGYPGLTLTRVIDTNGDGLADPADPNALQMVLYQVMDLDGDGRRELRRCTTGCNAPIVAANWPVVMEGIEDMGIAYAYDGGSGDLARFNNNPNAPEIWAVDTNDDNQLDINVDTNGDGNIDINDDFTAALNPTVATTQIRAARIWLLARSTQAYPNYTDTSTYVLGRKQLVMTDAANANRRNFRHLLLESVVALQNYELDPNK